MIIKKVSIENFRAYKRFECEFVEGINLVIGDNGVGKTSLLAAITQLLSVQVSDFGGLLGLEAIDPHIESEKAGNATLAIKECFPIKISGEIECQDVSGCYFEIVRNNFHSASYNGNTKVIKHLTEQEKSVWPLINYQRFDREWKIGKNTKNTVEVETGLNERRDGYKDCLLGIGQDDKIQKWCLKMSMLEFEQKGNIPEFERFKKIIKAFLQTIEETEEDFEVSYSMEYAGLVMKKGNKIYPLYELSTGYKALLSMIMELAYRSVLLNPRSNMESTDQTGIVVIDEIDAHLHPKWQWKVIDALQNCFPKVQFIIATHSPIVIASTKNARLINLEKNGTAVYSDGAYGYNVSDVLDLKQGSISMPKVSAEFMTRLENAIDNGNYAEARNVIKDAGNEFGEKAPMYNELKDYYEINKWVESN